MTKHARLEEVWLAVGVGEGEAATAAASGDFGLAVRSGVFGLAARPSPKLCVGVWTSLCAPGVSECDGSSLSAGSLSGSSAARSTISSSSNSARRQPLPPAQNQGAAVSTGTWERARRRRRDR